MLRINRRISSSGNLFETLESRKLFSGVPASVELPAAALAKMQAVPNLKVASFAQKGSSSITNKTPKGYTPAQIRHAYGFDNITFAAGAVQGNGAGQTIAIVDAYDDPNIANDLKQFSTQFGLTQMDGLNGHPTFTTIKPAGRISSNSGWALETALDVEWAHAIAPQANIVLVEATTNSIANLLSAVDTARSISGVVAVSMSWGSGEFSSETSYDYHFTTPANHKGITFVASSGDAGAPVSWPAISSNVLSVGGTTLNLDASGNYLSETGWSGSGGGVSLYEAKPSYQSSLPYSTRSNPDVSYNADPNTGFPVYSTVNYSGQTGWFKVGGTSAGAPQWAALIAIADQGRATSLDGVSQTLPAIYSAPASLFHDVTSGSSTGSPVYTAGASYDLVTGVGSPYADTIAQQLLSA